MTLAEFLSARLAEDERIATGVTASPWACEVLNRGTGKQEWVVVGHLHEFAVLSGEVGIGWMAGLPHDGEHIARHDPARVLREVAAGRRLLAEYEVWDDPSLEPGQGIGIRLGLLLALQIRATAYENHPDYDPAWAPPPIATVL
jgi:hypothetical protein